MEHVKIVRDLSVFGMDDNPVGHSVLSFNNVPVEGVLGKVGDGFEIAQSRLI